MRDLSLYETIPPQKNDFTLKFRLYEERTSLFLHWHEHMELLFILNGRCEFVVGGRVLPAARGDLIVVNGGEVHSFTSDEPTDYYCLIISPAFFSDVESDAIYFQNLITEDDRVREIFEQMNEAYASREIGGDMMQKSHAYRLMAHLMKNYRAAEMPKEARDAHNRNLTLLDRVKSHIAKNYQRHITTDELARICFFSIEYFCRFFKRMTGRTALAYINEYRIEKAAVLLTETDEPVGDIAAKVGFEDLNYFSRVFKRIKKLSPSEYRKEAKQ